MPGEYLRQFPGSKATKLEADHPPACSTGVMNEWRQTRSSFITFMVFTGVTLLLFRGVCSCVAVRTDVRCLKVRAGVEIKQCYNINSFDVMYVQVQGLLDFLNI